MDAYESSLRRLQELDVDVLCQGHLFVYTGADASSHLAQSLESAAAFRDRVLEILDTENGDVEKAVTRLKAEEWDPKPEPKQHEAAYLLNARAKVGHLAASRA